MGGYYNEKNIQLFLSIKCVGSSPTVKKSMASFLVPEDRQSLDASRVQTLFFV